jgi:hypothetical protein
MPLVRTPRVGGGDDMREIWFAHVRDQKHAVQAPAAIAVAGQDTKVTVLGTVRHAVLIDQLGVPEGEVERGLECAVRQSNLVVGDRAPIR